MRQYNNKQFDTIQGASASHGEIVSSQFSPLECQKDEKMTYSELIDEVQNELDFQGIEVEMLQNKLDEYCELGLIGDPSAEYDEEEFDEGDVDNAVDMIDTDLEGGK